MANIKSAEKRIRVTERKTKVNRAQMSELRTYIKKFNLAIENNQVEEAQALIKVVDKKLKKAAQTNLIHDNKAARDLSHLTKKLNAIM